MKETCNIFIVRVQNQNQISSEESFKDVTVSQHCSYDSNIDILFN